MSSRPILPPSALRGFPDLTGELLEGRYRVGPALGVGGMGAVFAAEHVRLGRKVALKVMRPAFMHHRDYVERFLREARAASQIRHPNVVEILDVGETPDGTVYSVMEFLQGEDLASVLRRQQRLGWPESHAILSQVVDALGVAHDHGVIHRDIKPANCILIEAKGEIVIKVVDFGIAKLSDTALSDSNPLTKTGEILGTPAYMAPELAFGKPATPSTDVYSVGVLAYEMVSGNKPFTGSTPVEMHYNQTSREPPPLVDLPPGVDDFIVSMLGKTADLRPAGMSEVARRLAALGPRQRATLLMAGGVPRIAQRRSSSSIPSAPVVAADGELDAEVTPDTPMVEELAKIRLALENRLAPASSPQVDEEVTTAPRHSRPRAGTSPRHRDAGRSPGDHGGESSGARPITLIADHHGAGGPFGGSWPRESSAEHALAERASAGPGGGVPTSAEPSGSGRLKTMVAEHEEAAVDEHGRHKRTLFMGSSSSQEEIRIPGARDCSPSAVGVRRASSSGPVALTKTRPMSADSRPLPPQPARPRRTAAPVVVAVVVFMLVAAAGAGALVYWPQLSALMRDLGAGD